MGLWHSAGPHWLMWGLWHGLGLAWLMYWGQQVKRRKIGLVKTRVWSVAGWAMTLSYVALGGSFTVLYGQAPIGAAFRLVGMALGLAG
jgi:D-alanyl-lipoteichoic acid acyltransferase DltB (MBOAT superfamily)